MSVVLDTCGLLFWTHEPSRLCLPARQALDTLAGQMRGLVSAAAFWEIALKCKAGRLDLGMSPAEYHARVRRLPLDIVPVNADLWLDSVALDWNHRDPVDRLVVALARREDAAVITTDRAIRAFHAAVLG